MLDSPFPAIAVLLNQRDQLLLIRRKARAFASGPLYGSCSEPGLSPILLRDGMDMPWGEAEAATFITLNTAQTMFHGTVRNGVIVALGKLAIEWPDHD